MPTTLPITSRFATMSAPQVIAAQAELLVRYRREDAERAARRAAILAL